MLIKEAAQTKSRISLEMLKDAPEPQRQYLEHNWDRVEQTSVLARFQVAVDSERRARLLAAALADPTAGPAYAIQKFHL
jgi:hypothetical protein